MREAAKALRFPLGGYAADGTYRDTTYPTEDSVYSTPRAVNVLGACAFALRRRGGSRPGLSSVSGVSSSGETAALLWPDGSRVAVGGTSFAVAASDVLSLPDGTALVPQHPAKPVYRARLFKRDGAVWAASRTGDFSDFDFGADGDEPTRPVAGTLADAGEKGEVVTALCPIGDRAIYAATRRRLAVCSGEPTSAWATVSATCGIVSADAWCDADGALVFVGPNGLYAVADGVVTLLSARVPKELRGLSSATLLYDPKYGGVHVLAAGGDWFFDLAAKAFWPLSYAASVRPEAGFLALRGGVNALVFRCSDGVYREWNEAAGDDDGNDLASSVAIGPFRCGVNEGDGILDALEVTLAEGGAAVSAAVSTGRTAEACAKGASPVAAGDFSAGYNPISRVRARGAWAMLTLTAKGRWAYESIIARTKALGRLRP